MYMTSVLWSDQNDIVIYRSFREFKKMHVSHNILITIVIIFFFFNKREFSLVGAIRMDIRLLILYDYYD